MGLRRRAGVETSNSSAFRKGAPAGRLARDVGFVNPVSGRKYAQSRWMSVATANRNHTTNATDGLSSGDTGGKRGGGAGFRTLRVSALASAIASTAAACSAA